MKQSGATCAALDCFPEPVIGPRFARTRRLAMTLDRHVSSFSRRHPPEFCSSPPSSKSRGRREGRVAAAPGAPAQKKFARAREPQVQTETLRPSLRSGLRLIGALLGEPSRLPPSPREAFQLR